MPSWEQLQIAPDQSCHLWNGSPAYASRFDSVQKFHFPGLAPVKDKTGAYHIDATAYPIYTERYDSTFGFYQGRAAVQKDTAWFHISTNGERLYENSYAWCGNFQEDRCAVRDFNGFYFHIDSLGHPVYAEPYTYAGDFRDGIAAVQNNEGLYTHIDAQGRSLHNKYFLDLDVFHKGYARAKDVSGWFHIDTSGKPQYPQRFAHIEPFYNGQARVECSDGSILIIDPHGSVLQEIRSSRSSPFLEAAGELVGYWRLLAIDAAVRLGVFESLNTAPPRLLLALLEMGLVKNGTLSEKGKVFQCDHPLSLAKAAQMWSQEHLSAWRELTYSLQSGQVGFEKLSGGKGWFDWVSESPERVENYHQAISSYADFDYASLGNTIDFSHHRRLIDVGGGQGILSKHLLKKYPHLQITILDRQEVLQKLPNQPNLQFASRDFFQPWNLSADAIILARVLHDWPDESVLKILQYARDALTQGGTIYILEMFLDEETGSGALLDLNMLVMTGGKERSALEFEKLLTTANLQLIEIRKMSPVVSIQILQTFKV